MKTIESLIIFALEIKEILKEEMLKFQWDYDAVLKEGDFLRTRKPLYLSLEPNIETQKPIHAKCFYVLSTMCNEKHVWWVQCLTDFGIFWIKQSCLLEYKTE